MTLLLCLASLLQADDYGLPGTFSTAVDSMRHPAWPGKRVFFFHPRESRGPLPLILFCHGINAPHPSTYGALIDHLVSRGYALIYSPYASSSSRSPLKAYRQMQRGIDAAALQWRHVVDTTKVALVGHSYGGGAVPSLAFRFLAERNWGQAGAALFIMAPWFMFDMTPEKLAGFPGSLPLIVQVYENDRINDHRIALDIFHTLATPDSLKRFMILFSDTTRTPPLLADHSVPSGGIRGTQGTNELDRSGIWRPLDALLAMSLQGVASAAAVAFRESAPALPQGRRFDGTAIAASSISAAPPILHPQNYYLNFWNHTINPRNASSLDYRPGERSALAREVTIRNYVRHLGLNGVQEYELNCDSCEDDDTVPAACRIPPPTEGPGAAGPHGVLSRSFQHPGLGDALVYLHMPQDPPAPVPVILLAPGYFWPSSCYYWGLIRHLVSQGNAVVVSTYRYRNFGHIRKQYQVLLDGFDAALELISQEIDTTRVGFIGHDFGGGALPRIAYTYLVQRRWGQTGSYLFSMAPWYMQEINRQMLTAFPTNLHLAVQVYENDRVTDYRIAQDLFYSIALPADQKYFLLVPSDTLAACTLGAGHAAPLSEGSGTTDAIDYFAIWATTDFLAARAFSPVPGRNSGGVIDTMRLSLGNWPEGPEIKPLSRQRAPSTAIPQKEFIFNWRMWLNPRRFFYHPDR